MIELIAQEWTHDIARKLINACGDDMAVIADDVKAGRAQVFEVTGCGYVVLRMELTVQGNEMVIVAAEGKNLKQVMPVLIVIGVNNGANTIRLHTKRPGIERMAGHHGFVRDEIVMKKVLKHGQQII